MRVAVFAHKDSLCRRGPIGYMWDDINHVLPPTSVKSTYTTFNVVAETKIFTRGDGVHARDEPAGLGYRFVCVVVEDDKGGESGRRYTICWDTSTQAYVGMGFIDRNDNPPSRKRIDRRFSRRARPMKLLAHGCSSIACTMWVLSEGTSRSCVMLKEKRFT